VQLNFKASKMLYIEFDKQWLNSQGLEVLKTMVKERGLSSAGNKTDMMSRLLNDELTSELEVMVRMMKPAAVREELESMNEFAGGLIEDQRRRLVLMLAETSPTSLAKKKKWAPRTVAEVLTLTRPEIAALFREEPECRESKDFVTFGICALSKEEMAQQIIRAKENKKNKRSINSIF
jgi:hypothetical protein